MFSLVLGLLCLSCTVEASSVQGSQAHKAKVTPVEKVIELLTDLQSQLEKEAKDEAAQYDKYACFCKEQVDEKQYLIEKSEKKISELDAEITKLGADIVDLNDAISELAKSIAALEAEIAKQAKEREQEHADYVVKEKDTSDAIAALEGAIEALKESKAEMTDAKLDLLQKKTSKAVQAVTDSPLVMLSQEHSAAVMALPKLSQKPTVYEYHSNDIIATLDGLLKFFLEKKKELDTAEFESNAAWEKRDLDMKNSADFQTRDKEEKTKISAYKEELKEKAEAEKSEEEGDMAADGQFLAVLKDQCQEKAKLWDQRSSTRSGELTAIASALEDLTKESGVADSFGANKKLVGLQTSAKGYKKAPAPAVPSFLQLRGRSSGRGTDREAEGRAVSQKVVDLLSSAGSRIGSPVLSMVALKVQNAEDHFVKVRQIIKDLMARLEADAQSEQEQKGFCDEAMTAAMKSRDDAQAELETLAATKAKLEAEMDTLNTEIADLAAAIADLKKALIDATEIREAENAENMKTLATAEEGKAAVTEALEVLKEFYSNAFVQKSGKYVPPNSDREGKTVSDRAPDIFDATYHGDQVASKGIVGLLEVILSDFERTISTVTAEEQVAADAFAKFKSETEADIDTKEKSKKAKEARVVAIKDLLVENKTSTDEEQKLLDAGLKSLEELHGPCVAGEETYDDRVAAREKEIEALKQALQILIDWQA
jgi:flagellin-specific chaperone FliS